LINNDFLKFKPTDIEKIKDQIKKDVEFFKKFNLMDYSLLLAVERNGGYQSRRPSSKSNLGKEQVSSESVHPQENFLEAHLQNSKYFLIECY
jgi:hypothetical protein